MLAHLIARCTNPFCRHKWKNLGRRQKYVEGFSDMILVAFELFVCQKCKKEKEGKRDYGEAARL